MALTRLRKSGKKSSRNKANNVRTTRGVGTRRANPNGYVPSPGSPSLDELKKFRHRI